MLKIICLLLVFSGSCIMLSSIAIYRNTLKTYSSYLPFSKNSIVNRHTLIMVMMIFFFLGYLATLFYISNLTEMNMSLFLIAIIFFFGAIFCFSVVYVQSELLNRLEKNADELRNALQKSETSNATLEKLNQELVTTMDALKNAQNQLVFSEKMSTLGVLMAGISHEINTPISVVRASAQSLDATFSEQFSNLFLEIRELSEDDFHSYLHYMKIAITNTRRYTSTMEVRILKRKAREMLMEVEGFNDTILEVMARNSLLDEDTVMSLIPLFASDTFNHVMDLTRKTVSIVISIDNISISTEKVIKMVSSLKTFSHHNVSSEKNLFNIIIGIESVLSIYTNELKYDVEVVTEFENVPDIMGYEDELSQVWSNLIQNAIHAMQNNASSENHQSSKLTITVKQTGENCIAVSISDNGRGIDKGKLDKIFEPFYTTKPTGIGTGLGLSISKQIIEKHKGTISAISEEGYGTTFTISLPF